MKFKSFCAELIATYCFVFLGVASVVAASLPGSTLGQLGPALAHGLALGLMVSVTAHISGGQVNPAITLAVWLGNKISLTQAIANIVGQVIGGFLAVRTLALVLTEARLEDVAYGVPTLGPAVGKYPGMAIEAIATFAFALVVFGTMVDARSPKINGLYVGLAITAAAVAIGPFTGACLNPARYLGSALASNNLSEILIYTAGPILGAAAAALVYTYGIGKPDPEPSAS